MRKQTQQLVVRVAMVVALAGVTAPFALADDGHVDAVGAGADDLFEPAALTEKKRQWLKNGFTAQARTWQQKKRIREELDLMSPREIDRLVRQVQNRQAQRRQQQLQYQRQLAYQNQLLRRQQAHLLHDRHQQGVIGYAPVVTWLPQGTSMTAGAVVSPDGRSVRVGATPFFSSVGPVHTFNMQTGEYQRVR